MPLLNKKYPPIHGTLTIEKFDKLVDHDSFPKCDCCDQPIYNPNFYEMDMCGPCTTGESATIMWHEDEIDGRYSDKEFLDN